MGNMKSDRSQVEYKWYDQYQPLRVEDVKPCAWAFSMTSEWCLGLEMVRMKTKKIDYNRRIFAKMPLH
jgi:hypothetical protein